MKDVGYICYNVFANVIDDVPSAGADVLVDASLDISGIYANIHIEFNKDMSFGC